MAEREGFEPSVGFKPTHAFQACALNRSATSPQMLGHFNEKVHGNVIFLEFNTFPPIQSHEMRYFNFIRQNIQSL